MATASGLGIDMATMDPQSKFKTTPVFAADEETGQQKQPRRKGFSTRAWLIVSESGQSRLEEVGRHWIMRRSGLPARDLRALDPMLSYPSSILGRERAIVVNLEHIRAIITAKELLMLKSTNPLVVQFVDDLLHRIASGSANCTGSHAHQDDDEMGRVKHSTLHSQSPEAGNETISPSPKGAPFEFRALEACLESACRCLESETKTLEEEAYPALDELTSKISSLNLDRVRQIKSRLVAISGRVQKVRDELEHLLDDDNDMAEMYLTEKLESHMNQSPIMEEVYNDELEEDDDKRADDSDSGNQSENYTNLKPDVEELEMLLEAYFAQIDGILQKLSGMSEYVDDTEDFINIMLDDKQNQLLQMGVMLSTANMILNAGIVVVGLFGMNITINLFDDSTPKIKFWETVWGTVAGCVALYLIAVGWGKKKKLIAL